MPLLRKLVLSGDYADTDWMDPGITPPAGAPRVKITGEVMRFALRGRASSLDDAAMVSLGAMTVDAYVLVELPGGGARRGLSIIEAEGDVLSNELLIESRVADLGRIARLHLTLTAVTAPVIDVLLLSGGRPL